MYYFILILSLELLVLGLYNYFKANIRVRVASGLSTKGLSIACNIIKNCLLYIPLITILFLCVIIAIAPEIAFSKTNYLWYFITNIVVILMTKIFSAKWHYSLSCVIKKIAECIPIIAVLIFDIWIVSQSSGISSDSEGYKLLLILQGIPVVSASIELIIATIILLKNKVRININFINSIAKTLLIAVSIPLMFFSFNNISNHTFYINSIDDLTIIDNMPQAFSSSASYVLEKDLDFKDIEITKWEIFNSFSGVFDGNNHYIKNLFIRERNLSDYNDSIALVGWNNGLIKNLGFYNCCFVTNYGGGGIIANVNEGGIYNCRFINTDVIHQIDWNCNYFNQGPQGDNLYGYVVGKTNNNIKKIEILNIHNSEFYNLIGNDYVNVPGYAVGNASCRGVYRAYLAYDYYFTSNIENKDLLIISKYNDSWWPSKYGWGYFYWEGGKPYFVDGTNSYQFDNIYSYNISDETAFEMGWEEMEIEGKKYYSPCNGFKSPS